jgi:ABC-type transport system involved in cytochrome c biogenesis permease component
MNLLNKKNFAIGSLIIMILSIPVIIFSVGLVNTAEELMRDQINILLGIMFLFLAITPWICSICIKLAIQEK